MNRYIADLAALPKALAGQFQANQRKKAVNKAVLNKSIDEINTRGGWMGALHDQDHIGNINTLIDQGKPDAALRYAKRVGNKLGAQNAKQIQTKENYNSRYSK